jgi:CheY-like chemotaxis protein
MQSAAVRILVVEDDAIIRYATARVLRNEGYEVLETSDGMEGHTLLAESAAPITMVITDVRMPGPMQGDELAREAKRLRPGIGVLLVAGVVSPEQYADLPVLVKPVTPTRLLETLRETLASQGKSS